MSPASKFWLILSILVLIYLGFLCIWIPIILYVFYSIVIGIIYIDDEEYQPEEVNKEFRDRPWVRPTLFFIIPYSINKFNNFLNNKFTNKPKKYD